MEKNNEHFKCFRCGHELCWDSSGNLEDMTGNDDDRDKVIDYYHCQYCGADYEVSECTKSDEWQFPYYNENQNESKGN